ncbi:MAG: ABC transporter permease subunit [Patescibacteria group bacterium]
MKTIFLRTLQDRKYSILIFCISGVLLLWLYILMFPTMQDMGENILSLMESYPPALKDMFPISEASFTKIENFLAMEQYSLMIPVLIIFMVAGIAAAAFSSEIEKGTIEILLSRPVSRISIFFGKYLVGLSALALFIVASTFMIIPLATMHNVDYSIENFLSISLLCFIFGWAVFSIAMLLSVIFSERSKVFMIIGGMMVIMYVMQIVSSVSEKWENAQFFSFFYYYDYENALLNNSLDLTDVLVFAAVAVSCTAFGFYWFNRRDVST